MVRTSSTSKTRAGPRTEVGETSPHRRAPSLTPTTGLGAGVVTVPPQHRADGEVELTSDDERQRLRLIEPTLGLPPPGEWHPRHDVCRPGRHLRHRSSERISDSSPAGELQPVHRRAEGALEEEGSPGANERCWWTVPTRCHLTRRRRPATIAPRWHDGHDLPDALRAERPRSRTATGAPTREHDVEHTPEHPQTLARDADTHGRCTSSAPASPRPRAFHSVPKTATVRSNG